MSIITWFNDTFSLPATLACIGALLSTGSALWASFEQNKAQKLTEAQTIEIKNLNTKILNLSEENKFLAKEGISSVTGGDGLIHIDIIKGKYPTALAPAVISNSKYPQYDISIRFYDESKSHETQIATPLILNIATLPAEQIFLGEIPAFDLEGKKDYARFNLFISARNGYYIEELRLRKVKNEWFSAFRIFKERSDGSKKILLENSMVQYPKSADGTPVW